jgi:prepilin-type N-terminal cleavage/methylation domain-containing protein
MKDRLQSTIRGFTLLETLITVTIIGGVGILIAQVFFTTTKVNTKTELLKEVKQNGQYGIDTMSRMIRSSTAIENIDTSCSSTGSVQKTITIKNPDGFYTTLGCLYSDSATRIASASGSTINANSEYLTSSNITLGGDGCDDADMTLKFTCTSYPDQAPSVVIQFSLSQKEASPDQFSRESTTFQTTVSPRF